MSQSIEDEKENSELLLSLILVSEQLCPYLLFNGRRRKKVRKVYQELNEEDTVTKKWNQELISKAILLLPQIAFYLHFSEN